MKFQICQNLQFLKDNDLDIKCQLTIQYEIELYKEALDFMFEVSKLRDDFYVDLYNPSNKYWEQNGFNNIPNKRHSCGFISSSLYATLSKFYITYIVNLLLLSHSKISYLKILASLIFF